MIELVVGVAVLALLGFMIWVIPDVEYVLLGIISVWIAALAWIMLNVDEEGV